MRSTGRTPHSGGSNLGRVPRSSLLKMLWRAVRRRCPWCGGKGAFFTGWFAKGPSCATCGLRWRRGDVGFELGAAAIAAILTLGPLILALGIILAITWPTVAVLPLLVVLGAAAVILPIITYPLSYTIWQSLDVLMRPVEIDDFDARRILDASLVDLGDHAAD